MKEMTYKGFTARIMETERLQGDQIFGLPPGNPMDCYPVDMFLNIPQNWMRGSGVFLVPVSKEKGLWFDFTRNDANNTAVIMTIKGCNPLTGLPTSGYHLERYDDICPRHGVKFFHERFCPECNYKWPSKNYLAGNCETLWRDTWLSEKGVGRQFFFTEDELRDVASAMIGKENTVPAFGFAFYRPKEMRQPSLGVHSIYHAKFASGSLMGYSNSSGTSDLEAKYESYTSSNTKCCSKGLTKGAGILRCSKKLESYSAEVKGLTDFLPSVLNESNHNQVYLSSATPASGSAVENSFDMNSLMDQERSISLGNPVKEVSVGCGAKINQSIGEDPYPLDSWKESPDSVMTVYFVFQEKFEEIKKGGIRDFTGKKEGMLSSIPVG